MKLLTCIISCASILFSSDIKDIKTYSASFTQSIINNSGTRIEYKGSINIKQPNSLVWLYKDPIEKNVYVNSRDITIIEPDLEQAIISRIDEEINLLDLLQNAVPFGDSLYKASLHNIDYNLKIINGILIQIKYNDMIDNKVEINFHNIEQNHKINDSVFRFKIPRDFDIIRK